MGVWIFALALLVQQVTAQTEYCPVIPTDKPCCESGFTRIDLTHKPAVAVLNYAPGVEVLASPTPQYIKDDCSNMALLKINFEKISEKPCYGCLRCPMCGRRMLRIDLELSGGTRQGWGFNLGDSKTNNGYAGDAGTQSNDAEADGRFPNVVLYANDKCGSNIIRTFNNALASNVKRVTIYVSNQHIRIVNDQGVDVFECSKEECLYALNGQSDSTGPINEDLFLGLNRVIDSTKRRGIGVCNAILSWACDICPGKYRVEG